MVQKLFVIMNDSINKKKQTSLLNHAQQISKTINDMDKLLLHPELRDIPFSNLKQHFINYLEANNNKAPTKNCSDYNLQNTLQIAKNKSDYKTNTYPQFVEHVTGITVTNKFVKKN